MKLLSSKTDLKEFLPHVIANTITYDENEGLLPEAAALSFIRNSAIKFAEKTGILKKEVTIDLQCGLSEYPIVDLNCERVIGVNRATLGQFETQDCGCSWNWGNVCFEFDDDVLHISPAPEKDIPNGLTVEVVVVPSRDACEVDSRLYDLWHDAVINGALSEIHLMSKMPWSSVSRGDYRKRLFEEDISRAVVRRTLKGHREPLKASPNPDWFKYRTSQRKW